MASKQSKEVPQQGSASFSPEEVLTFLTGLLGRRIGKDGEVNASHLPEELVKQLWSTIPWEQRAGTDEAPEGEDISGEEEGADPNFSSFPSFSLERSPQEELEGDLNRQESIEAHVSSLLSRPILVSNNANNTALSEDEENDSETLEFIAEAFDEVPDRMLQNFFNSFTTLMNSRLRAYATFLARHGLTLVECSETAEELEDGVTGVEQKLETMLEIGRLVSSHAVETSFRAKSKEATTTSLEGDNEKQVVMPIFMDASIVISLPRPVGHGNELVTVSFRANGSIAGIFERTPDQTLRVVQVDLNMSELLPSMIKQASCVISRIVEMTNAAYSLALPGYEEAQAEAIRHKVPASPANREVDATEQRLHIVSPSMNSMGVFLSQPPIPDLSLGPDETALSAEKCEHLVDCVFREIDDSFMRPSSPKKAKHATTIEDLPVAP